MRKALVQNHPIVVIVVVVDDDFFFIKYVWVQRDI